MSKGKYAEAGMIGSLNQTDAVRTAAQTLACLLFVVFSMWIPRPSLADPQTSNSEIQGTITECWEGKQRPVSNLRVYVLAMEENSHILALLKNIEQAPVGRTKENFKEYLWRIRVTRLTVFMGPGEEKDCKTNKS
jgi:hypothetical protein